MVTEVYRAPDVAEEDLTPEFVRDELLRCFESANHEFLTILEQPANGDQVRAQVRAFVTGVFQQCGVNFEQPTRHGILTAIEQCRSNAEQMMGDAGVNVIRHHYDEMMRLVSRLPD
jgi:ureidoglycolate hydrolase